jgi:hypothetical protein
MDTTQPVAARLPQETAMPAGRPRKNPVSSESVVSTAVENEVVETQAEPETLPALTQTDLLTIIASMQKQLLASQSATAELAGAIKDLATPKAPLKSRKQVADEENEKLFQDRQIALERTKKRNDEYLHSICEHIAGSNKIGEGFKDLMGRTSYQWHRNDVGVEVGVCSICQDILLPDNPRYMEWRRKPQFGKMSSAGQRTVLDYADALDKSVLRDS